MSVIMMPRKSQDTLTIVDSSSLTSYQVTSWDIKVIIVLWTLFLVTSIFVMLRLYSRVKILQFYAAEDYLYNIAFVCCCLFSMGLFFFFCPPHFHLGVSCLESCISRAGSARNITQLETRS